MSKEDVSVGEILHYMETIAPSYLKQDYDNVGLLVGFWEKRVTRILVALDITAQVIQEAIERNAQLIVSHHPLYFSCSRIVDTDGTGKKIITLIENGISAICMHTNLDAVPGGVNDALAEILGLCQIDILERKGQTVDGVSYGMGRVGLLKEPMELEAFLSRVKNRLNANGLRYHSGGKPVKKVAVLGGSGGSALERAAQMNCDTFVTADIKYSVFLAAKELVINLIDADHFCTENVVCPAIKERLASEFPWISVFISKELEQTARFF